MPKILKVWKKKGGRGGTGVNEKRELTTGNLHATLGKSCRKKKKEERARPGGKKGTKGTRKGLRRIPSQHSDAVYQTPKKGGKL